MFIKIYKSVYMSQNMPVISSTQVKSAYTYSKKANVYCQSDKSVCLMQLVG